MKMKNLFSTTILFIGTLLATHASPADDITAAGQKLANEANYSWHTTVAGPAGSPSNPGPVDGKIQKGGLVYFKRSPVQNPLPDAKFSNLTLELFMRGTNVVINDPDPDGGWQTLAGFSANDLQGPGPFVAQMMQSFAAPADMAAALFFFSKNLKQTDGAYTGDLAPGAAEHLLAGNSSVSNASGTVQFWIKDGELSKFEYKVEGTITSGDNAGPIKRDTTVEIQNVGTTTINVPADAKKLLP